MSGYLYQVRYALLLLLQKMEHEPDAVISLETRDDIVFEKNGDAKELLQLKHTVKATAGLSDRSSDLWKTLRIWSEDVLANPTSSARFILVTCGAVSSGSIAEMLKIGKNRDVAKAGAGLDSVVKSFKKEDANVDYDYDAVFTAGGCFVFALRLQERFGWMMRGTRNPTHVWAVKESRGVDVRCAYPEFVLAALANGGENAPVGDFTTEEVQAETAKKEYPRS